MASSNPFRKSMGLTAASAAIPGSAAARFPPLDSIDTSPAHADAADSDNRSKTIKKVRVLSPPPLSPDSPEWPYTPAPLATGLYQSRENDPFEPDTPDDSDREIISSAAPPPPQQGVRVPANPFSKTLRDIETSASDKKLMKERRSEGDTLKVANTARRSLDVNSFKRLLMTGNLGADAASGQQPVPSLQKASGDSSSISFSSSSYDGSKDGLPTTQEVSLISREASDNPDDDLDPGSLSDSSASFQISRGKKPPPPPSSRHGRSIKLELGNNGGVSDVLTPKSSSDINKPLPPAPRRSLEHESGSQFERDAGGKVPAVEAHVSQRTPSGGKKSGPAPPPRRGHSRRESKTNVGSNLEEGHVVTKSPGEESLSRSSSIRSRNEVHGPLPPPPPRRSHGSKQSTVISSEVAASIGALSNQTSLSPEPYAEPDRLTVSPPGGFSELSPPRSYQTATLKGAAPPPPPTRNVSVRRPASIRSVDSTSRRTSAETKLHGGMAPPPPPRRQRGSSQTSMDGFYRRTSLDEAPKAERIPQKDELDTALSNTVHNDPASPQSTIKEENIDILADLTALQREVDALRGKLGP